MGEIITVENPQLGRVTIASDKIATFPDGLIGFENLKQYAIIDLVDFEPFQWLLSIDEPGIIFPIISPLLVVETYAPLITKDDAYNLGEYEDNDLLLYAIVTIRPEIKRVTANLRGPVIINQKLRLGQQIVLDDEGYSMNQEFMSGM